MLRDLENKLDGHLRGNWHGQTATLKHTEVLRRMLLVRDLEIVCYGWCIGLCVEQNGTETVLKPRSPVYYSVRFAVNLGARQAHCSIPRGK